MNEICGDIGQGNLLSFWQKLRYLGGNAVRGIRGYFSPQRIRRWKGTTENTGSASPSRAYIDTWLLQELPRQVVPNKVRILDIGCGSGYLRSLLADQGYSGEYVGVDVIRHPSFNSFENSVFASQLVEAPIGEAETGSGYDVVVSNTSLEHMPDDRQAARIAYNALREEGTGIHVVPSFWCLPLYLFHGYRQYTPARIAKVFQGMPYRAYRLGGFVSFMLHLLVITLGERILGMKLRRFSWYAWAVACASRIDQYLPFCSSMYVVVVRKKEGQVPGRRKVLFALPSLLAGGGIERQLSQQLRLYDRARFTLATMTLFDYGDREEVALPEDVHRESMGFRGKFDIRGWVRLVRFLKEYDPDVVVTSMFSANTALRLLKPFFQYRVIAREHNVYEDKNILQHAIDRVLARATCRLIAVSRDVADFAARESGVPRSRFTVIENGIDVAGMHAWQKKHDRSLLRQELGFTPEDIVVLTVGRLKQWKNHAMLVRAVAQTRERYPALRLVVIGSGSEKENLTQLITQIPEANTVLLERMGEDVWPYYAAADWFMLPSLREGFPNVVLEALSFGLPVISTPVSGVRDCIEDDVNGFLVAPAESAFVAGLKRAASAQGTDRHRLVSAAYETAQRFDVSAVVEQYEQLFTTCAPGSSALISTETAR